jgi:hypothetical protein
MQAELVNAWYKDHLPTYTGKALQIIEPPFDLYTEYQNLVRKESPACIEGDYGFVESVINQSEPVYIPILSVKSNQTASLVFRSPEPNWNGTLGVVHPQMSTSGRLQIDYWKKQINQEPNWVAFLSSQEALRHLLAGTVDVAAVTMGDLERFLRQKNRLDLLNQCTQLSIPSSTPNTFIFLRKDLYDNLLLRILITETWLRNNFTSIFQLAPVTPASNP